MSGKSVTELSQVAQTANAVLGISGAENPYAGLEHLSGLHQADIESLETRVALGLPVDEDDIRRQRKALSATIGEMRRPRHDPHQEILDQIPLGFDSFADPSYLEPAADPEVGNYLPSFGPDDAGNATPFLESAASIGESEAPRIQAFAKLEFDDGQFYMNTYAVELGRDVRAARAAMARDLEVSQKSGSMHNQPNSSGGNASQNANRVKPSGSGIVAASVVSEKAGIIGIDPEPQPRRRKKGAKGNSKSKSKSTSSSSQLVSRRNESDVKQGQKNYQTLAMQSLSYDQPHPVDAGNLLPSPDETPLIPIHPPAESEEEAHNAFRGISRRHVRIAFNFQKHLFEVEIKGRNGAFIDDQFYTPGDLVPLKSGSFLQIGGVGVRFLLPDVAIGETGAEGSEPDSTPSSGRSSSHDPPYAGEMRMDENSEEEDAEEVQESVEDAPRPGKGKGKSKQKSLPKPQSETTPSVPPQQKKRGPGRPPKDGISSKREKAEAARAAKLAAKKEANGGMTPPPTGKGKLGRPRSGSILTAPVESKPEKRKYTKRRKSETDPQENGEEEDMEVEETSKSRESATKRERSPSPDYGNQSDYTAEQLAKPKESYQYLVYDLLKETPPHQMDLKDIYRGLKKKYPYFVFKVDTQGWQSSVRHNLNQTPVFKKLEKAGKGWLWGIDPDVTLPNDRKRRASPPPPPPHPAQPYSHQGPQLLRYPPPHAGPMAPPPLPQQPPHLSNGFLPTGSAIPPLVPPPSSSYTSPYQSPYGPPAPPQPPQDQLFVPQNGPSQVQAQQHPVHNVQATPALPPSQPIWPTVSHVPQLTYNNIRDFKHRICGDPAQEVTIDSAIDRAMGFKKGGEQHITKAEADLVKIMDSLVQSWGWKKEMAETNRGTKRAREDDDEDGGEGGDGDSNEDDGERDESENNAEEGEDGLEGNDGEQDDDEE